ncbi:MAG: crossover junction endodeoxyribonuclease RuvC [Chloroflexota bacterium]
MLILGLDPGTATTGYGLVRTDGDRTTLVEYGAITTPAHVPLSRRLQLLHTGITGLIAAWQPNEAAVEQLFFSRNVTTALAVGHARGVLLLSLADAEIPLFEYTPAEVKQAVVGYGRGRKEQVQEMVRILLSLEEPPTPDDAADALAIAICHVNTERMRRVIAASQ